MAGSRRSIEQRIASAPKIKRAPDAPPPIEASDYFGSMAAGRGAPGQPTSTADRMAGRLLETMAAKQHGMPAMPGGGYADPRTEAWRTFMQRNPGAFAGTFGSSPGGFGVGPAGGFSGFGGLLGMMPRIQGGLLGS